MEIVVPDKNLVVETTLGVNDVIFREVRNDPFEVYGLYDYKHSFPGYLRMPSDVAEATNPGVAMLNTNTAGGRVRFSTDSPYIAIRVTMPGVCIMPHMPLLGSAGFDLYLDDPDSGRSRFLKSFMPPMGMTTGYESILPLPDKRLRSFTIHFPLYNPVNDLFVGVQAGSVLGGGMKYRPLDPIIYYGSSITQGGCASRPGNAYQNVISRRMNVDHINLGFSGSGCAELPVVDYMASLPMSAFVSDYDHNASGPEYLAETHFRMYEHIRAKHPDVPYIMISRPDFTHHMDPSPVPRRNVICESFRRAWESGDRNVYFIDGEGFFRGRDEDMCTVDGCHPNDLGFAHMADVIGCELDRVLNRLVCPC